MKTSNKILLGTLLTAVLIITGIHLALYAKYKSGDFASAKEITDDSEHHALPAIKYVSITGLNECSVSSTGTPELVVNKARGRMSFKVIGDTLFLTGDSTATTADFEKGQRNSQMVNLTLPAAEQVKLAYGTVRLSGGLEAATAPSYSIELATDAHLGIIGRYPESVKVFFKKINLVTNHSNIELDDHTVIDELHVRAVASELFYHKAQINQLAMDVDSTTTVTLSGKSINKLLISKP